MFGYYLGANESKMISGTGSPPVSCHWQFLETIKY